MAPATAVGNGAGRLTTARRMTARDRRRGRPVADGSGGTLVGLAGENGVVLAADTRASRGATVSSESVQKLVAVHPTAAMGSTDDLGAARAFVRAVRAEADRQELEHGEPMGLTALATFAVGRLRSGDAPNATFVLGGVDDEGVHVLSLSSDEGAVEAPFVAVGSGRQVAYGVLDDAGPGSLAMAEARRVVVRALATAAARDGRTGVGVTIAEVTADGVDLETHDSVDELT